MNASFFNLLKIIESALAGPGEPGAKLEAIADPLKDPDVAREFWSSLQGAEWIQPLRGRGYFGQLPAMERLPGGNIRFPVWQASKYLARVASLAPTEVAGILKDLRTDNAAIVGDVLDAALAMPPPTAALLVPGLSDAARSGSLWMGEMQAARLCAKLASEGQVSAAIELAESLFAPATELGRGVNSRRHEHWMSEGLNLVAKPLALADPKRTLPLLCNWLEKVIKDQHTAGVLSEDDFSYIWRPAVEEHEQNQSSNPASVFVSPVRMGFEGAIERHAITLAEAILILEPFKYLIFRRLAIYLVADFGRFDGGLVTRFMTDKANLDDGRVKHEYARLVSQWFGSLSTDQKKTWLSWIDAGPALDAANEADPELPAYKDYWRFQRLHWVKSFLERTHRQFYEKMLREKGAPELSDLTVQFSSRWGDDATEGADALRNHTFAELVDAAKSATAETAGIETAFTDHLRLLGPSLFAEATALEGAPAPYVRNFVSQVIDSVQKGLVTDLSQVLSLCEWVLRRPVEERTTSASVRMRLVDPDWQWTRDEISRLIEVVCNAEAEAKPTYSEAELHARLWALLDPLCKGKAESGMVREGNDDDARFNDYLDLGINSSRGRAVQAALAYARWRGRASVAGVANSLPLTRGMQLMPEVREMLEWQLAPANRTVEALSVIGSKLNILYWIDREWLSQVAQSLFQLEQPDGKTFSRPGWAAWNSFLVWVRPNIEFYKLFKSQFLLAVDHACAVERPPDRARMQPMQHLGEHLMLLYGRGDVPLEEEPRLIHRFVTGAAAPLRVHAIGFVGRSLSGETELPAEVIQRFMVLWELYWATAGKADAKAAPRSFLFGQWFASGKFPSGWAMARLKEFTDVVGIAEPDHSVMEKLAADAASGVPTTLAVLANMIEGDTEGWHVHGWIDEIEPILTVAVANEATRSKAVDLINLLGRRGIMRFRAMLPKEEGPAVLTNANT